MKTIVITGISQGIGYETTKAFVKNGDYVIGLVRKATDKEKLEAEFGAQIRVELCDLQNETDIINFGKKLIAEQIKVDVLINNAGIIGDITKDITTATDLKTVFATNVFAVQTLINQLLPVLKSRADVISISSGIGHYPTLAKKDAPQYALSKSALNTLMQIYAATELEYNFNVLYPGMVQTRIGLPQANRQADEVYAMIINVIEHDVTGKCFKEFKEVDWITPFTLDLKE